MEEAYWRYVKSGDVESYLSLWHEDFVGWPCLTTHPMSKENIGDWVRQVRDEQIAVTYDLRREAVESFGGVVVAYYATPMVYTFPDGRTEYEGQVWKLTHTWMKLNGQWQIVGGMCGQLNQ
jgi:hypothetical protein